MVEVARAVAAGLPDGAWRVAGQSLEVLAAGTVVARLDPDTVELRGMAFETRALEQVGDAAQWLVAACGPQVAFVHAPQLAPQTIRGRAAAIGRNQDALGFIAPPGKKVVSITQPRDGWALRWDLPQPSDRMPPSEPWVNGLLGHGWGSARRAGGAVYWCRGDNGARCWIFFGSGSEEWVLAALELPWLDVRGVAGLGLRRGDELELNEAIASPTTTYLDELLTLADGRLEPVRWVDGELIDCQGRYWLRAAERLSDRPDCRGLPARARSAVGRLMGG